MRETQRRLLRRLVERIPPHPAAHGFVRGSSTADFAAPHADRPMVPASTSATASSRSAWRGYGASSPAPGTGRPSPASSPTCAPPRPHRRSSTGLDPVHAGLLRARHLPQGVATSPHLANLVLRRLDRRLDGYARHNELRYTRYGDDLAFSGDRADADRVLWTVGQIVDAEGFRIHPGKTRVMHSHQRQALAGLVVNDRPRVRRSGTTRCVPCPQRRAGLALPHRTTTVSRPACPRPRRIAWIGATSLARRARLLEMAARVDWER